MLTVEVFTTGGILLDTVVAADGTVHADGLGGNAAYSAAGARLWASAGCVGVVPRNFPARWLAMLREAGINTSGVHRVDEDVEGTEWFFHRADGSRVDHLHGGTGVLAPGMRLSPAEAGRLEQQLRAGGPQPRGFGAFRAAHPVEPGHVPAAFWRAGVGVHQAPNRTDAQLRLLARARDHGATVSLDPGRQADGMTDAEVEAALAGCDVFLPSEKELRALVPGKEPVEAVLALAGRGALVVGKLGPAGSVVAGCHPGQLTHVPALPCQAPDPTGAGDAYCGGFLAAFVRTRNPVLAACCGTVSASFAVAGFGPWSLLAAPAAEAAARLRWTVAQVPGAAGQAGLDELMKESTA